MEKDTQKGITRLIAAFHNSRAGFNDIWRREEAFRQEFLMLILSIPFALWLGQSLAHTGLLVGSVLLLLIVEIINSAIEAVVDRIGPERHELSRIAKDLGSLAVLATALIPATVWGCSLLVAAGFVEF